MPQPAIYTDAEARQAVDGFTVLTEPQQADTRLRLQAWKDSRSAPPAPESSHLGTLYLDGFDAYADKFDDRRNRTMRAERSVSKTAGTLNEQDYEVRAFLRETLKRPSGSLYNLDVQRVGRDLFDMQGPVSPTALHARVKQHYARVRAINATTTDAARAGRKSVYLGEDSPTSSFYSWQARDKANRDPEWSAAYYRQFKASREAARQTLGPHLPLIKQTGELLQEIASDPTWLQDTSKPGLPIVGKPTLKRNEKWERELDAIANAMADIPEAEFPAVLRALRDTASDMPGDKRAVPQKVLELMRRGVWDSTVTGGSQLLKQNVLQQALSVEQLRKSSGTPYDEQAISELERRINKLSVKRQLNSLFNDSYDELDTVDENASTLKSIGDKMLYGTAETTAYMAQFAVSPVLAWASTTNHRVATLEAQGASRSDALRVGSIQGAAETALERITFSILRGRTPAITKFLNNKTGLLGSKWQRRLLQGATVATVENLQEFTQDVSSPVLQELARVFGSDVPDVDLKKEFSDILSTRDDVAISMLPILLAGWGVGIHADNKSRNAALGDRAELRVLGLSEKQVSEVIESPNRAETLRTIRAEIGPVGFTPELVSNYRREVATRALQQAGLEASGKIPTIRKTNEGWQIETHEGSVIPASTFREAATLRDEVLADTELSHDKSVLDLIDYFAERAKPGEGFAITDELTTLQREVDAGIITRDQALERLHIAEDSAGAQHTSNLSGAIVLGRSEAEWKDDVFRGTATIMTGGSDLLQGGSLDTAIEEKSEVDFERMTNDGTTNVAELGSLVQQWDAEHGDSIYKGGTPLQVKEAWSDLVKAFVISRFGRRAKAVDSQANPLSAEGPASFREGLLSSMLFGYKQFIKEIIRTAVKMRRATKSGRMDARTEALLAETLGTAPAATLTQSQAPATAKVHGQQTADTASGKKASHSVIPAKDLKKDPQYHGVDMVSPSLRDDLTYDTALAEIDTKRQAVLRSQFKAVNDMMSLEGDTVDVLGVWADGAENSLAGTYAKVPSYGVLRAATALKGALARQKAVIVFVHQEHGPATLVEIRVRMSGAEIARRMADLGIGGETIYPTDADGTTLVKLFDPGDKSDYGVAETKKFTDATKQFIEETDADHVFSDGQGEFLGSWDSREEGHAAYKDAFVAWLSEYNAGAYGRGRRPDLARLAIVYEQAFGDKMPVPVDRHHDAFTDVFQDPDGEFADEGRRMGEVAAKLQAMAEETLRRRGVDIASMSDEQLLSYMIDTIRSEVDDARSRPDSGEEWYDADVAYMERTLRDIFPSLRSKNKMVLFKALIAFTSFGNTPSSNFFAAIRLFVASGEDFTTIQPRQADGKGWTNRAVAVAHGLERLGWLINGKPAFPARAAVAAYVDEETGEEVPGTGARKASKAVKGKGVNGAARWLLHEHPASDLRVYNADGISGQGSDMVLGGMIMGDKGGPFFLNLNGIEHELTMDLWFSRAWNRLTATLLLPAPRAKEKGSGWEYTQDTPRNDREREMMRTAVREVAKQTGLSIRKVQAIWWYYEQRLYTRLGMDAHSGSFREGSQRVLEGLGFNTPKQLRDWRVESGMGEKMNIIQISHARWASTKEIRVSDMVFKGGADKVGTAYRKTLTDFIKDGGDIYDLSTSPIITVGANTSHSVVPSSYVNEDGGDYGVFKVPLSVKGKTRLYRAAEGGEAVAGESFSEELSTALAYTTGAGFGGPNVFSFDVTADNPLYVDSKQDLADAVVVSLTPEETDSMGDTDATSMRQEWNDSGYGYTHDIILEARVAGLFVGDILARDHDWIVFEDSYPAGATTHWKLSEPSEKGTEIFASAASHAVVPASLYMQKVEALVEAKLKNPSQRIAAFLKSQTRLSTLMAEWRPLSELRRTKKAIREEGRERYDKRVAAALEETRDIGGDAATKQEAADIRADAARARKAWEAAEIEAMPAINTRSLISALSTLDAILAGLPAKIRGRVGGYTNIAKKVTDQARLKYLLTRLELADKYLEAELVRYYVPKIKKLVDSGRAKKRNGVPFGKQIDQASRDEFDSIVAIMGMDSDAVTEASNAAADALELDAEPAQLVAARVRYVHMQLYGDIAEADAARLAAAHDDLKGLLDNGRSVARELAEREKERLESLRIKARIGFSGGLFSKTGPSITERNKHNLAEKLKKVSSAIKGGYYMHLSWEQLLNAATRADKASETYESPIARYMADAVHIATHGTQREILARVEEARKWSEEDFQLRGWALNAALKKSAAPVAAEDTGVYVYENLQAREVMVDPSIADNPGAMAALGLTPALQRVALAKFRTNEITGQDGGPVLVTIEEQDHSKPTPLALTQFQAAHLSLIWRQEDLRAPLEHHGFNADTFEQIESFLSPQVKALREHVAQAYLDNYPALNKVFKRMFGVTMPQHDHYAPSQSESAASGKKEDNLLAGGLTKLSSSTPSLAKSRVRHLAAPDLSRMDLMTVYFDHVRQSAQFIHWSETLRDIRSVFGELSTKQTLTHFTDRHLLGEINLRIEAMAQGGTTKASEMPGIDWMRSNFTKAKLAGNIGTSLKQILSLPAYMFDTPPTVFLAGLGRVAANLPGAIAEMRANPFVKERLATGWEIEVADAMRGQPANRFDWLLNKLMWGVKAGDIAPIYIGGWIHRQHAYKEGLAAGLSPSEADARAQLSFEKTTERAQQASALKDASGIQVRGGLWRVSTMFTTTLRQYTTAMSEAVLDAKAGRKGAKARALRIWATIGAMQVAFSWVSAAWSHFFRNDGDDPFDWGADDAAVAFGLGPLYGFWLTGPMLSQIGGVLAGGKPFGFDPLPLFGDNDTLLYVAARARDGEMTEEEFIDSAVDGVSLASSLLFPLPDVAIRLGRKVNNTRKRIEGE